MLKSFFSYYFTIIFTFISTTHTKISSIVLVFFDGLYELVSIMRSLFLKFYNELRNMCIESLLGLRQWFNNSYH